MIRTKTYPLPARVKGFCVEDACGDYDIIINAELSPSARLNAYRHELAHIACGDFDRESADQIEILRKECPAR